MSRLNADNERIAHEIIARYPRRKSALIPLLHLPQEQHGWVSDDAIAHIAELVEVEAAEVLGTCSFYEMFKRHPVGEYHVNICHGISCHLLGADALLQHAEESLGVTDGGTTADNRFTLEAVECIAACTEAPCLQVNYRYINKVSPAYFDELMEDIRSGTRPDIPSHGTLAKVRQKIPADRAAGPAMVDGAEEPGWLARNAAGPDAGGAQ
ncbi:MAG: NADH-quinone oxidoreductase subunit NuoE [Acidimicrobiales bacterium]